MTLASIGLVATKSHGVRPGIDLARRHLLINQTIKGHKSQKEIGFQIDLNRTILDLRRLMLTVILISFARWYVLL